MKLTIIGAGPGGYVAALKAARLGAEVTIIEDTEVGGTCLNKGCIPTKTLIASAEAFHKAKNLDEFGIDVAGPITANLLKIMARKNKVVSIQVKAIRSLFKSWGVNLMEGRGVILAPKKVGVRKKDGSEEIMQTDRIIIATGSRPARIPIFPFDGEHIMSSDDADTDKVLGVHIIGPHASDLVHEGALAIKAGLSVGDVADLIHAHPTLAEV